MKRSICCLFLVLGLSAMVKADEGMWMVNAIDRALELKMKNAGLKLPANVIYDEEAVSVSDAITSLAFTCSGSMTYLRSVLPRTIISRRVSGL